jgi:type VI secretion system Hcp family effector
MTVSAYIAFQQYSPGTWLASESQVDLSHDMEALASTPTPLATGKIFEVASFTFDIAQTLNLGSSSSGAGAGKVTFNPFSITRKVDKASPLLFEMACSGTPFESVVLALRRSSATPGSAVIFLRYDFKLVAVKTISWSSGGDAPMEAVTFEYGGLQVRYAPQTALGGLATPVEGGWNRIKIIADVSATPIT